MKIWIALCMAWSFALPCHAQQSPPDGVLRVCQDPNNLPFSNLKGEGYENKIAELLAQKLGWTLEYTSFPQRMGFIRNTLRFRLPGEAYRCDLVIGVPADYTLTATTQAYFRSTYALVIRNDGITTGVRSESEFLALPAIELSKLKIGVHTRSPGSEWLTEHGLIAQAIPYLSLNADPDRYPGEMIERDLAGGRIDAALVWGPIAGYFAARVSSPEMTVIPLQSTQDSHLDFAIAMGMRQEDKAWQARLNALISENRDAILAILRAYRVPLLDADRLAAHDSGAEVKP